MLSHKTKGAAAAAWCALAAAGCQVEIAPLPSDGSTAGLDATVSADVGLAGDAASLPSDASADAADASDAGAGAADAGTGGADGGAAADAQPLPPLELTFGIDDGLALPAVGAHELRIVAPTVLELYRITSKAADPARVDVWDFVDEASGALNAQAPKAADLQVLVAGQAVAVEQVGFRRRVRYAPLVARDLRIGNAIVVTLASPIADGQRVEVKNPSAALWQAPMSFEATLDPERLSAAIHVNQLGYGRALAKRAQVGHYLGSLGELLLAEGTPFTVVDARSGSQAFAGTLRRRADSGFTYLPTPYQQVLEADFTALDQPGEYRVLVPGLGGSYPFSVDDGVPAALARAYALGLFHQRCGADQQLPFTRFDDGPDHLAPAEVLAPGSPMWSVIAGESSDFAQHQAPGTPQLKDAASMLYPFVRAGKVDVSLGHHDAGDYSKYTANSALLVNALVFAADAFPGVAALDNLGLPESGDGKSDVLQIARWEAEFLARMQDDDGGFYFLVYPRDRRYEQNVTPANGDGQVLWPKTTSVSASATAALAQIASSQTFQAQFPVEAAAYLAQARKGFAFLEAAIAAHGKEGAYQKITHYGNNSRHDDELAWAAVELFLATGEASYRARVHEWMPDPSSNDIKRWSWWRLFEAWGNATRSYAFATQTGRRTQAELDADYLAKCRAEVVAAGQDQLARASASSYGTSFPLESKAYRAAGWYFSSDQAFDLVAAQQISASDALIAAVVSNLDYEAGSNPVNVSYLSGIGWKQQREIVHQQAQNDLRVLPPSGIPLGNIQSGFQYFGPYNGELGKLGFPSDGANEAPYPFYDRWGDSFNVTTEFVVPQSARALGTAAALMAASPLASQAWRSGTATIVGVPAQLDAGEEVLARLESPLDLSRARVVWDGEGIEPGHGPAFRFCPAVWGPQALEAEAHLPDGRRVFAVAPLTVLDRPDPGLPVVTVETTQASAPEAGPAGRFTVTRTGDTSGPLTVRFSLGGTAAYNGDYNAVNGNYWNQRVNVLELPAGAASVGVHIAPLQDVFVEQAETVILTLLLDPAYDIGANGRGVVTITDDD